MIWTWPDPELNQVTIVKSFFNLTFKFNNFLSLGLKRFVFNVPTIKMEEILDSAFLNELWSFVFNL